MPLPPNIPFVPTLIIAKVEIVYGKGEQDSHYDNARWVP